ncbi:hypothetical protein [Actinomadura rugatobispora]|uniref:XRE family transcriptional regulator n=1 Tax=Actinomadura rugatobispora TaxID=1994 RepID=A0ABW1AG96_9ACTN|nr:hypothetical protein GCM10010200_019410 [Actinomadura rugatobispora]
MTQQPGTPPPAMDFTDRLRASGLSLWELGDLLGIHPHYLRGQQPDLHERSVTVLIEICRRLDAHPTDLVPALEGILRNQRRTAPASREPDIDQDARTVLTALTVAAVPLTRDALAQALDWTLHRAQQALDHALNHPQLAGPLALRRVPPDAYTLTPRLDALTTEQHHALAGATRHHATLTEHEATVLLAAIGVNRWPYETNWNALRTDPRYQATIAALKEAGILYSDSGPHRIGVHPDVLFSLRYEDDTRLARQLGEDVPFNPHRDPWPGAVETNPDGTVTDGPAH